MQQPVSPRDQWALQEGLRFINHGAFGATPIAVTAVQAEWRARMERNPPRFFMTELPTLLRAAASELAAFVGTDPARLGFVTNATAGVNAVLRSLRFGEGDEILFTDHVYNAVRNALRHVAQSGASLVEARIGMPVTDAAQVLDAIAQKLGPRTRLVVIDHVASASAVAFPVAAIAALCRARGVRLLIDGAHAPGLLELDVDAIDADFYVGNCHKWLCAPKSVGFLAVAERAASEVHPLAISHAYGQGFTAEFDKVGTHDASAALAVPAAIRLQEALGGAGLRARNRALAGSVAVRLAGQLATGLGGDPDLFHGMVTVLLPTATPATRESSGFIQQHLWARHGFEAAITAVCDRLYLRISAHAYNDEGDYDGLAAAVRAALDAMT
jgi:isopenicillin-N epimerase